MPISERNRGRVGILVVDDEDAIRDSLQALLSAAGFAVVAFGSSEELRQAGVPEGTGCILIDVRLGTEDDGIELLAELRRKGVQQPIIVMTGHADVPLAVRAMREGASDFIEKPFDSDRLLTVIAQGLATGSKTSEAASLLARLTSRERQVFDGLASGMANKVVALELGISVRTVEAYRATIMTKLNLDSLADLVRLHLLAGGANGPGSSQDRA